MSRRLPGSPRRPAAEAPPAPLRGTNRRAPTAAPRSGPFVVPRAVRVVGSTEHATWSTTATKWWRGGRWRSESTVEVDGRRLQLSNLDKVLLPGRLHQGRGRRLLRAHRAGPAAAHRRPADVVPAVPGRHRQEGLLRQERAEGHARLGADRPAAGAGQHAWTARPSTTSSSATCRRWSGPRTSPALELHVPQWTRRAARRRPRAGPAGARPGPRRAGDRRGVRRGRPAAARAGRGRRPAPAGQDVGLQGDAGVRRGRSR